MKTYAIYMRPRGPALARRAEGIEPVASATEARRLRHRIGHDALIHVGEEHPDPLPQGERLWQEPGGSIPDPMWDGDGKQWKGGLVK